MKARVRTLGLVVALGAGAMLAGCLEVEQYPRYVDGRYDGKPDMLAAVARFHGDRLAWNAAINDRTHRQNEYERTQPPSREGHPEGEPARAASPQPGAGPAAGGKNP